MSVLYAEVDIHASKQATWTALYKERVHYETKVTNWEGYYETDLAMYNSDLKHPENINNSYTLYRDGKPFRNTLKDGMYLPYQLNYHMSQTFRTPLGNGKLAYDVVEYPFTQIRFKLTDSNCFKKMEGFWSLYALPGGRVKLAMDITDVKLKLIPVPAKVIRFFAEKKIKERLQAIKVEAESL